VRIVFHLGLFKTGTTSLQNALYGARAQLLEKGVLYPDGGPGRENHRFLTPLFKAEDRVERSIRQAYGFDRARMLAGAEALWEAIRREAERTRPKLLVLSTEHLFAGATAEGFRELRRRLAQMSGDVDLVLYFREPAAHFASTVQQAIKTGQRPFMLRPDWLQGSIPELEAAFGRSIAACVADRDQLVGGDIVRDFIARFVSPVVGPVEAQATVLNESISPEVAAILDSFRRGRYPDWPRQMPDFHSLRRVLARVEALAPRAAGGRLRPEIAAACRAGARDALWLRERYGIVFSGLDYEAIDGSEFDPEVASLPYADLFEIDEARRERLEALALAETLEAWRQVEKVPQGLRTGLARAARVIARRRPA
jgi:hypothetical protein